MQYHNEYRPVLGDSNIAALAALLAEPARVAILFALSDGRAFPAGELARRARVALSTASTHLGRLVESGLIKVEQQGRHRYFRLADPAIIALLENMAIFAPASAVHSLHDSEVGGAVRRARTCYDHLAGQLGVQFTQALLEKKLITAVDDGYALSADGERWLSTFGVDERKLRKSRPLFVPRHIDWSERRYHIAGSLGAAITRRLFELGWIEHLPSSRAVRVTDSGQKALERDFGVHWMRE